MAIKSKSGKKNKKLKGKTVFNYYENTCKSSLKINVRAIKEQFLYFLKNYLNL